MSALQESANAATMLFPLALAVHHHTLAPTAVTSAIMFHFPFSFAYHSAKALALPQAPLLCKLDLMAIHVASSAFSHAVSKSTVYFLLCALFNSGVIWRLALGSVGTMESRVYRGICSFLYLAPIWNHGFVQFVKSFLSFALMAGFFVFDGRLGGWGHCISHLWCMPLAWMLIKVS